MKKWIVLSYIGITFLFAANAQAATNLPLVETETLILLGIGLVGLIGVKRKKNDK